MPACTVKTKTTPRGTGVLAGHALRGGGLALSALLSGCQRAPAYSILGSFFPVWLFCAVIGVLLSFLLHLLLVRLEWNEQLAPPLLVYPAIAILFALGLWLVFFS